MKQLDPSSVAVDCPWQLGVHPVVAKHVVYLQLTAESLPEYFTCPKGADMPKVTPLKAAHIQRTVDSVEQRPNSLASMWDTFKMPSLCHSIPWESPSL